jgi:thioredoxin reductase
MNLLDVIIVGGGPAGLNAAMVLARCRRKVYVFDTAEYRNRASRGMHNYLTRDGILPLDFIRECHHELKKYHVVVHKRRVVKARQNADGFFVVEDETGEKHFAKKLLIATGLADNVPEIEGFREFYGKSVFHCPYCDGCEVQDRRIGVYARDKEGAELALALKGWSPQVTLYTDGKNKIKPHHLEELAAMDIPIDRRRFARLEGRSGQLEKIVFRNGEEAPCEAIFFVNGYRQQCNLAETFDCEISRKGVVMTNRFQQTSTPGLFVAGDADKDVQFVVVAAAEGAKAGVIINKELQKEVCREAMKRERAEKV